MQGRRNDVSDVIEMCKAGASVVKILESNPKLWGRVQAIEKLAAKYQRKRRSDDEPPKVFLYWGESGAGKTRAVYAKAKQLYEADIEKWQALGYTHFDDLVYSKMPGCKWLDGYEQQPIILIDDFNSKYTGESEKATLAWLQRIMDRYQCTGEIKGGTVNIFSEYIFITSNQRYDQWFSEGMMGQCSEWIASLKRRFHPEDGIRHFTRSASNFFTPIGAQPQETIDLTQDEPGQPFFD